MITGRRSLIGGSDARIIMGEDEAALAFGMKNGERTSPRICPATS
jgi:hypothetical protein